jgi:hypothetical protein
MSKSSSDPIFIPVWLMEDIINLNSPGDTVSFGNSRILIEEMEKTSDIVWGTDDLGVWMKIVLKFEDKYYITWASAPCEYWLRNSGDSWDDWFPSEPSWEFPERCVRQGKKDDETVKCYPARKIVKVTWDAAE